MYKVRRSAGTWTSMRASERWSMGWPVAAVCAAASLATPRMSLPMTSTFMGTAGCSGMGGGGGGGGGGAGGVVSDGVPEGVGDGIAVCTPAGCASVLARLRLMTATAATTTRTSASSAAIHRRRPLASKPCGCGLSGLVPDGSEPPGVLIVPHIIVGWWDQCPPAGPPLATCVSKLSSAGCFRASRHHGGGGVRQLRRGAVVEGAGKVPGSP